MNEENDAIDPIEAEVVETAEAVEEEQSGQEPSESSTEKKENPAQKRIDELTRLRREAERERDYWRSKAEQPEPVQEAPKPIEVKALEDFDYDEGKYQAYLFEQARLGAVEEAKRVLREEQARESVTRKQSEFNKRIDKFSESVDDFDEVVRNPSLSISQAMADIAIDMDDGPAVLYYLGKNPDIADQIARMSPLTAAREMGKIEAKLAATPKAEKVSKAPAPAPKIGAVEAAIKARPDTAEGDTMTTEQWLKARQKQLSKR